MNTKFELPDRPYPISDIQDYVEYIIKKRETLTNHPPVKNIYQRNRKQDYV